MGLTVPDTSAARQQLEQAVFGTEVVSNDGDIVRGTSVQHKAAGGLSDPAVSPGRESTSEAGRRFPPARLATTTSMTAPAVVRQQNGINVLFRVEQQLGNRYYLFLPEQNREFPIAQAGSYIVRRPIENGELDQIKVFLQNDEHTYVRIRPNGKRAILDVVAGGALLYDDVPLPLSMRTALTLPFEDVVRAAGAIVDWDSIMPDPSHPGHDIVRTTVERIRGELPNLPDAEDGAMSSSGDLVFIESLQSQQDLPGFNCSGFAKWVVDGLIEPLTGQYLSIEPLKEKHLQYRGTQWSEPAEDARDPYFGLDWSRNLARTVRAYELGTAATMLNPESCDVRSVPVSAYLEDTGYRVADLRGILYWLAVQEPGHFYIGSVNREFGAGPTLRQHTHLVVMFPYFGPDGRFYAPVMERNVETSVESLERRYGDDFIHLVRVRARTGFQPPVFRVLDTEI